MTLKHKSIIYNRKFYIILMMLIFNIFSDYAQSKTVIIKYDESVKDYIAVFNNIVNAFIASNDNSLTVNIYPGSYPIASTGYYKYDGKAAKTINFVGIPDSKNNRPFLYTPGSSRVPVAFFRFEGTLMEPVNLDINIKNLILKGNNIPYSQTHPFFGNKAVPITCLLFSNTHTFKITNVDILNIYGNGIVADNTYSNNNDKKYMIEGPVIDHVKVQNCWSQNFQNNCGTGILIGYSRNPQIINCSIFNDLLISKYYGFVALDLETRTDGAVIKNNTFGGYHTLIHTECDYGGHSITNNKFKQSLIGINLSEDCNQDPARKNLYRPDLISGNIFEYGGEYERIGQGTGDWGFISIYKPSFTIEGMKIENNVFKDKRGKNKIQGNNNKLFSDKKVYLDLKGQSKVSIKNNTYE